MSMSSNWNTKVARKKKWENLQPTDKVRLSLTPDVVVDAVVDEVDLECRFLWVQIGGSRERKLIHYADRHTLRTV